MRRALPPRQPVAVGTGAAPSPAEEAPSDLAVETVLADFAFARLGTLLQSTREERSDSRRVVADQLGMTARELRRYETGRVPVPRGILTALAEFDGEDLDSRFGHRNPLPADPLAGDSVEAAQIHSGDGDEVVGAYVEILRQRPEPTPDESLTLRAEEVTALSTASRSNPERSRAGSRSSSRGQRVRGATTRGGGASGSFRAQVSR